jgi:hypothetical protein
MISIGFGKTTLGLTSLSTPPELEQNEVGTPFSQTFKLPELSLD